MSSTAVTLTAPRRERLVRYAQLLAWSSLVWMTAEGVIAVVAGVMAGSIALIGFGIDSAIEGMASVVIIWRFWGRRALSENGRETRAEARGGAVLHPRSLRRLRVGTGAR